MAGHIEGVAGGDHPLLSMKDVTFGYRGKPPVLSRFNLTVNDGQFVALLGPSGGGKTTVMNLVAGFLTTKHGEVSFDGQRVSGPNTRVAYMTQGDTLLPWRTVANNVRLPLELRHVDKRDIAQRVDAALKMVHLEDAADSYPAELSGGMKRRALLARSMIYDPKMLLMDEPFAALDAQLREKMHKELLETMGAFGKSVLFITHDISESIILADRIVLLMGKPAAIAEDIQVPFGKDRDIAEIRHQREYVEIERILRKALRHDEAAA